MGDIYVKSFTHLEDKHNAAQALHMLKRIASLVKPIMKKRSWVLPLLSEFFPDNPNLLGLNVNMGQQILVRLRSPHSPDTLLQEEEVVQTMLHELTHNVHGPHDDAFYKYLTGLQDEYYDLQRSGHDAEGFLSTGRMLVSSPYHNNVPPNIARIKALEAAEKRAKTSRIISGGGRLGGPSKKTNLSPRELAARAAERRLRDDKSCGSGVDVKREVEKAKKESIESKVIDLTLDDKEPDHGPNSDPEVIIIKDVHPVPKPKRVQNAAAGTSKTKTLVTAQAASSSSLSRNTIAPKKSSALLQGSRSTKAAFTKEAASSLIQRPEPPPAGWTCSACTLINQASALQCELCTTPKPKLDKPEGWTCATCGEGVISHSLWTCTWCGEMKLAS